MDLSLKNDDHPVILQNNRSCPQSKHLAISALGVLHNSLKYIFLSEPEGNLHASSIEIIELERFIRTYIFFELLQRLYLLNSI